jgi:hypothetical protein
MNQEQIVELARCVNGHNGLSGKMYFLANYGYLLSKDYGRMRWQPWKCHVDFDKEFHSTNRLCVLKARQLGISWQAAGYALHQAIFFPGQTILLGSKSETESRMLLDKCVFFLNNLPEWMIPRIGKRNESTLTFPDLSSMVIAFPSTKDALRSLAANLIIMDEWAFHPYAQENWASAQPTLAREAKFVGISTADGRGNLFHQIYDGGKRSDNGFKSVFYSWRSQPERDEEWYENTKKEFSNTPHLLAQEYPDTDIEAFITTSDIVFDKESIEWAMHNLVSKPAFVTDKGNLKVWMKPRPGVRYVIGADVGEGRTTGDRRRLDFSCAAIYEWQSCRLCAEYHHKLTPDEFGEKLVELGKLYNNAFVGVERNTFGSTTLMILKQMCYNNIYRDDTSKYLYNKKKVGIGSPGWVTTPKTKPYMISNLNGLITSRGLLSYSADFWDECLNYEHKGNGTMGAISGMHDDRVMAHSIAMAIRGAMPSAVPSLVTGSFRVG